MYKARDTRLDRTVAIKVLPQSLAADPQFRDRFDREARAIRFGSISVTFRTWTSGEATKTEADESPFASCSSKVR